MRLILCLALAAALHGEVRVWQGTLAVPTYKEGAPDLNPPFDAFATTRFNYPYTLRENLTSERIEQNWRALFLENEYLKCSVLPDVGGHLYSCTDKLSGAEMFYANPTLKKARVGYRGAWSAFGIEFNFPVSHNWASMSPVDFATTQNPDGSASAWVANTDRPYGMRWVVELRLRPRSTVLEQHVTLLNPSPVRHRFYWWTNAGIEVWNDSLIQYPMRWTASHGFTFVDTWPVNQQGLDLRVVGNHTAGPVSQFAHGTREPYMGVYHPKTRAGTVHYAPYEQLPSKKIWAWGVDPDGLDWRKALSDNESAYVEVQGGLFRNQETYAFLDPQTSIRFNEYWMPVRGTGGITRANLHGVLYMTRTNGRVTAALNVNRPLEKATVRLTEGGKLLSTAAGPLAPERTWTGTVAAAEPVTFELLDGNGATLLTHTEGKFEWTNPADIRTGAQPTVPLTDPLDVGADQELNGRKLDAYGTYRKALEREPARLALLKAAGRLAVDLKRFDEAVARLSAAYERNTSDPELSYYLGLAYLGQEDVRRARPHLEAAYRQPVLRNAARLELARLCAREANLKAALEYGRGLPQEIALLRRAGRLADARQASERHLQRDPTDSFVRYEQSRLGTESPGLIAHLAADPERVLQLAEEYMKLGLWADALELLDRKYPPVDAAQAEPGAVLPQEYPLLAYYRASVRQRLGQSFRNDLELASRQSTLYVFPHRASTLPVLRFALSANQKDATAHLLLGSLLMSGGMTDGALAEWEQARGLGSNAPALHRNIARTLLELKQEPERAADVYREGLRVDTRNQELYAGLTQALALLGRPAGERIAALESYPDRASMPAALVQDLALSLSEAGRFDDAERLFAGRFFAREEGGTNVRQVWVEVRLRRALATGSAEVLRSLAVPVPGLAFTQDGLAPFLRGARFHYLAGLAAEAAGERALANEHWRQAAAVKEGPQVAFAFEAAKRLAGFDDTAWRKLLEAQLARTQDSYARGTMLRAMGREQEARDAFRAAILQPERGLTRYLARVALSQAPTR